MLDWVFLLVVTWHASLILALLLFAVRAKRVVDRIVAFEVLSIVFVAVLAVVGIHRQKAFYLDIALVVAMLGFVQTVAAVRLAERRARVR
jgi:multisubunit Na+/H+ antiporter MnhF subunit